MSFLYNACRSEFTSKKYKMDYGIQKLEADGNNFWIWKIRIYGLCFTVIDHVWFPVDELLLFYFFFCNKIILFPLVWRFRYLTYFRHHIHLYTVRRVAVNYLILVFRHVGWTLSHSRLFYNHILLKFKNLEDVGVVLKKFLVKILNFLFFSSIIIYLFLLHRVFYIIIILCSGVSKKTAINSRYIFIICYVDRSWNMWWANYSLCAIV